MLITFIFSLIGFFQVSQPEVAYQPKVEVVKVKHGFVIFETREFKTVSRFVRKA